MTDYELLSLWYQIVGNLQTSMANYFAGVFGMLGVAYFVSHKLDRMASWLLVGLYTLFCVGMLSEMYELGRSMHRLALAMQEMGLEGPEVTWHPAVRGASFRHVPLATLGMVTLIYAATMVFYFRARAHKGAGFDVGERIKAEG